MAHELSATPATPLSTHPLDANPAAVYLAQLGSASGRRTMHQALSAIAALLTDGQLDALTLPWAQLRHQHAVALRSRLAERYQPATANKMLSALRGVLRAAWLLGQMAAEDYQRTANVAGVRVATVPAGRELGAGELAALLDVCAHDPAPTGARDGAIIALMYGTGLRRAEVVALDVADYDPPESGTAAGRLRVRGKGRRERLGWVTGGAAAALADWLAVRGPEPGPLFWPTGGRGRALHNARLTTQAIYQLLRKRAQAARLKAFSPHDLRRTFVSDLLDAGADIATVAKMAGHANVTTTARYDRRPEEAKQRAARLLHVPYRGRGGP